MSSPVLTTEVIRCIISKERIFVMILITDNNKKRRESVSEMFYYMGILSYPTSPIEALSEISTEYSAVLVISDEGIHDLDDYIGRLRSYAPIPIFSLFEGQDELFDAGFNYTSYSSTVALGIAKHLSERGLRVLGTYRLAGICADADAPIPTYFDKPLKLTKTETMILRYLIRSYPNPTSPTNVLKYAFKASRRPEAASVRTHISVMNKKFLSVTGRPLTLSAAESGYVIATPEIIEARESIKL